MPSIHFWWTDVIRARRMFNWLHSICRIGGLYCEIHHRTMPSMFVISRLRATILDSCFMARHDHNHLQLPEMDHIQPRNGSLNEPLPLGQKLFVHAGSDAPLRIGPSGSASVAIRSNDLPSSSRAGQYPGHRIGNTGTSHVPFVHFPAGSSSSHLAYDAQPESAPSYPHRSEEGFAPVSSHVDNRRAAIKRKNTIINPVDGISVGGYYVGSSSNTQFSNYVPPNPTTLPEPLHPQMPLSIGPSNRNDQRLANQEGSQRNVRARHNRIRTNISLEPRPASTYTPNNIHPPPFHSTASVSLSTPLERNQAPFSVPTRTVPSGATGITSRDLRERPYYPAVQRSNASVAAVPTFHVSSGSGIFTNGGYAPRSVHGNTVPSYGHPSSAASSGSSAIPHEAVIPSYPPASSAATSTSVRIGQPFPIGAAASSRHARHVSVGHNNSGRNRRARSSYYGFHPLMIEAERFMMLNQLVFYESREAADPHRDMRLDIDDMSYEDLSALGEFIGNVNTGLADEKISGCVREVVCCSSDQMQSDQDDGSCAICVEEYKDKELLGTLKCSHDFHADCIKKWLQMKNSCPVCKAAAA